MARHSREEAAASRARILSATSRSIRAKGIEGTAIPAVMRDAGLTHGSFYAHFDSKDALVSEACGHAFGRSAAVQEATAAGAGRGEALLAIVRRYLTEAHRDEPETGCPVPALAAEVARQPAAVRSAYTKGVEDLLARFERLSPRRARELAPALLSGIAGAIAIARAVDDPALSARMLEDTLAFWTRALSRRSLFPQRRGGPAAT
ncbi:MAG TPA: TetR/AcrR family transcriptional regulator [Anaeromyxobacter sp.]|nr:TetR/AcrR family transcriptional regulator [Anaeromyxobacter sp.]